MSFAVASAPERSVHPAISPAPTRIKVLCSLFVVRGEWALAAVCGGEAGSCPGVPNPKSAAARQANKGNILHILCRENLPSATHPPALQCSARIHGKPSGSRGTIQAVIESIQAEKETTRCKPLQTKTKQV